MTEEKNKGGRPQRVLTDEERTQLKALAQYLDQNTIADYLRISKTTLHAIFERDPEVSELYKNGKARAKLKATQKLMEKIDSGDTASIIFFLKTQCGWSETQKLEHTGKDGGAIEVSPLVTASAKLAKVLEMDEEDLKEALNGK